MPGVNNRQIISHPSPSGTHNANILLSKGEAYCPLPLASGKFRQSATVALFIFDREDAKVRNLSSVM